MSESKVKEGAARCTKMSELIGRVERKRERTSNGGFWDLQKLSFDEASDEGRFSNRRFPKENELELVDFGVHDGCKNTRNEGGVQ